LISEDPELAKIDPAWCLNISPVLFGFLQSSVCSGVSNNDPTIFSEKMIFYQDMPGGILQMPLYSHPYKNSRFFLL